MAFEGPEVSSVELSVNSLVFYMQGKFNSYLAIIIAKNH